MKFKKGDRVRFLNERGEGIITKIVGNHTAYVEGEDGFEIPFQMSELVSIANDSDKESRSIPLPETVSEYAFDKENSNIDEGVYLAFVPNGDFPAKTAMEVHLINHTGYEACYTIASKRAGDYFTLKADFLREDDQDFLFQIKKGDLEKYSHLKIDILFFKDSYSVARPPISEIIKLKSVKFYKDGVFTENPFFDKNAYVLNIVSFSENLPENDVLPSNISQLIFEKETPSQKKVSKQHNVNTGLLEQEFDLHIEELIDSHKGLSNAEIISIQLKHFQAMLDNAIANNIKKIVFIHGVGNGRLKHEVRNILKSYKGLRFHDGSYQRYGFGATEVLLY